MHDSVQEWLSWKVDQYKLWDKTVLEVGSRDINGTPRQFFNGPYTGVDMIEGVGVNIVAKANKLPFENQEFEVVVCTEMLEHDDCFWESIPEMHRVLKRRGHLLLTTRGIGFPYHEFPGDYWRFTEDSIQLLFDRSNFQTVLIESDPGPSGIFAHGMRK